MRTKSLNIIEMYNLKEIASLSGVSLSSLRSAVHTGHLVARKIGREYKSTKNEVLRFLNISEQELLGYSK